jgi:hypothetical protein
MPTQAPTGSIELSREITGHLGARAGVARHRLDLDDAVVDFRHLGREQLGQEARMGAGQEDLGPARLLAHVVDVGAHAVAVLEGLARDGLVAAQQRLGPAEVHHEVAVLGALDGAVDDLAHAVLVFLELLAALHLAHALDDHLLGGLRADAAEVDRRQRVDDVLAHLDAGLHLLRDAQRHLRFLILDHRVVGHDLRPAGQLHRARLAVDLGADVLVLAVGLAAGAAHGHLHGLQHLLALDHLLARHRLGDLEEFGARNGVGDGHDQFFPSGVFVVASV